jgi:hypothetical protein
VDEPVQPRARRGRRARDPLLATFSRLGPAPEALAEARWSLTHRSIDAWDERAPDTGPNRAVRKAALAEVERFAVQHEHVAAAARFIVQAAHAAARLHRAAHEPEARAWCARAVRAFEKLRASPPQSVAVEAEMAASCAEPVHAKRTSSSPSGMTVEDGDLMALPLPAAE